MNYRYLCGVLLLLVMLAGCGLKATSASSTNVYGIKFVVVDPIGNSVSTIKTNNQPTGERNARVIIGDVTVLLAKVGDDKITFGFNGDNYGTLKKGDVVQIGKTRNVTVNGVKRTKVLP